ncbi:MAG: hypothetical protein KF899_04325 [Parvibaculum sp.]|nr:hypothetical protein [Parvibaculum sp.]
MTYVIIIVCIIAGVVAWKFSYRYMESNYSFRIAEETRDKLRALGEPDHAIEKFLASREFNAITRGDRFIKPPEAVAQALDIYHENIARWGSVNLPPRA